MLNKKVVKKNCINALRFDSFEGGRQRQSRGRGGQRREGGTRVQSLKITTRPATIHSSNKIG